MAHLVNLALESKLELLEKSLKIVVEANEEVENRISSSLQSLNTSLSTPESAINLPLPLQIESDSQYFERDDDLESFMIDIKKQRKSTLPSISIQAVWKFILKDKFIIGCEIKNCSERTIKDLRFLVSEASGASLEYCENVFAFSKDNRPVYYHDVPVESCVNKCDRKVLLHQLMESRGIVSDGGKWNLNPHFRALLVISTDCLSFKTESEYTFLGLITGFVSSQHSNKLNPIQVPLPPLAVSVREFVNSSVRLNEYVGIVENSLQKFGFSLIGGNFWHSYEGTFEGMLIVIAPRDKVILDLYSRSEKQFNMFNQLIKADGEMQAQEWISNQAEKKLVVAAAKQAFLKEFNCVMNIVQRAQNMKIDEEDISQLVKKDSAKFGTTLGAEKELEKGINKLVVSDDLKCPNSIFEGLIDALSKLQHETNVIFDEK
ncbi:uncharacterized protein LOC136035310 isoform X2 [Artemia franciscana]|uniref:uncharacterized protein LOC136035310 isoform X2 n=1 Tax=Artemia franciscana TaxID=6661 RepID=UPI0032DB79FF